MSQKILTRQEAYNIGGEGTLSEPLRCCTRSVAESYGCDVSSSYEPLQLISQAEAHSDPVFRPQRVILNIRDEVGAYISRIQYYNSQSAVIDDTFTLIPLSQIMVVINGYIDTTLDQVNNRSGNYMFVDITEGRSYTLYLTDEASRFTITIPLTIGGIGSSLGAYNETAYSYLTFSTNGYPSVYFPDDTHIMLKSDVFFKVRKTNVTDPTSSNDICQQVDIILGGNTLPHIYLHIRQGNGMWKLARLCSQSTLSSSTTRGFVRVSDMDSVQDGDFGDGSAHNIGVWDNTEHRFRMYIPSDGLDWWRSNTGRTVAWLNYWDGISGSNVWNAIGVDRSIFYATVSSVTNFSTNLITINTATSAIIQAIDQTYYCNIRDASVYQVTRDGDDIISIYIQGS